MNNRLLTGISLFIFGIIVLLFILFYSFSRIESYYIDTINLGKKDRLHSVEIESLKVDNRNIKSKIEELHLEVNDLGIQMNELLQNYRASKGILDSLIVASDKDPEILDSLIGYYNEEILDKTVFIDSVNKQYDQKSNQLLHEITLLETNSKDLEMALAEKKIHHRLIQFKWGGVIVHIAILIVFLVLGIVISIRGFRIIREETT